MISDANRSNLSVNKRLVRAIREKRRQLYIDDIVLIYEKANEYAKMALEQLKKREQELREYIKTLLPSNKSHDSEVKNTTEEASAKSKGIPTPKVTTNIIKKNSNTNYMRPATNLKNSLDQKLSKINEIAKLYSSTTSRVNPEVGNELNHISNTNNKDYNKNEIINSIEDNAGTLSPRKNDIITTTSLSPQAPNFEHYETIYDSDKDPNLFSDVRSDNAEDQLSSLSSAKSTSGVSEYNERITSTQRPARGASEEYKDTVDEISEIRNIGSDDNYHPVTSGRDNIKAKKDTHSKSNDKLRSKRFTNSDNGKRNSSNEIPVDDAIIDLDDDIEGYFNVGDDLGSNSYIEDNEMFDHEGHNNHKGHAKKGDNIDYNKRDYPSSYIKTDGNEHSPKENIMNKQRHLNVRDRADRLDYFTNEGDRHETMGKINNDLDMSKHDIHIRDTDNTVEESSRGAREQNDTEDIVEYYQDADEYVDDINNDSLKQEQSQENRSIESMGDLDQDEELPGDNTRGNKSKLMTKHKKRKLIAFLISRHSALRQSIVKLMNTVGFEASKLREGVQRISKIGILKKYVIHLMDAVSKEANKLSSTLKLHIDISNISNLNGLLNIEKLKHPAPAKSFESLINKIVAKFGNKTRKLLNTETLANNKEMNRKNDHIRRGKNKSISKIASKIIADSTNDKQKINVGHNDNSNDYDYLVSKLVETNESSKTNSDTKNSVEYDHQAYDDSIADIVNKNDDLENTIERSEENKKHNIGDIDLHDEYEY